MRLFRSSPRPGLEMPSPTGLLVLFLFTMALPALLLLFTSLDLAGDKDLYSEKRIERILDGFDYGFRTELDKATEGLIEPYLRVDWTRLFDSSSVLEEHLDLERTDVYLFSPEGFLIYPLFPPSPFLGSGDGGEGEDLAAESWREAMARTRPARKSLAGLRSSASPSDRSAEAILEEARSLAVEGNRREAWEYYEHLIERYPDTNHPTGPPLPLVAMAEQIDLNPGDVSAPLRRMARALFLGTYYPEPNIESFLWRSLLDRIEEVDPADLDAREAIEAWRSRRERHRERAQFFAGRFRDYAARVNETVDRSLWVQTSGSADSASLEVQLVHRKVVENEPLLIVWDLAPESARQVFERTVEEVLRFNASTASLEIVAPSGRSWLGGETNIPVSRVAPLLRPWSGWNLRIGLEHAERLREQATRQRREAAAVVVVAALVLLIGTVLVFRGVRRQIQVTRAKSDFVSAVSHELRTPLANIRLYGEMLEMGVPISEEDKTEAYRAITSETERLSRLIEGVLNYSRVQRGKKVFNVELVDLPDLVDEVVERAKSFLDEPFEFRVRVEGEPTPAPLDPDAFSQALENLLSNAVKYCGGKREAEVEIVFGRHHVEVAVLDYGIGISRQNRRRVFERFHRIEDEMTRETGGAGLGLTLARDLVRGFGGDITVRSRLREGSRFCIVLPYKRKRDSKRKNANEEKTP